MGDLKQELSASPSFFFSLTCAFASWSFLVFAYGSVTLRYSPLLTSLPSLSS